MLDANKFESKPGSGSGIGDFNPSHLFLGFGGLLCWAQRLNLVFYFWEANASPLTNDFRLFLLIVKIASLVIQTWKNFGPFFLDSNSIWTNNRLELLKWYQYSSLYNRFLLSQFRFDLFWYVGNLLKAFL